LAGGLAPVDVSAPVAGLTPGATYHYRLVAGNADGVAAGADRTFVAGAAGADTTAPVISSASVRPRRVRRRMRIRFALSEAASVRIVFRRCVRRRGKLRCRRVGALAADGAQGPNTIRRRARVGGKLLR